MRNMERLTARTDSEADGLGDVSAGQSGAEL
jgi:hypothetical protein